MKRDRYLKRKYEMVNGKIAEGQELHHIIPLHSGAKEAVLKTKDLFG